MADQSKRKDAGKLRLDLVPQEWIDGLAAVCQMGAEKYAPWAWVKNPMDQWRCEASALRHVSAWRRGEEVDAESGLDHRLHAAWNLLASYYYDLKGLNDDSEKS
jgi:hypothetical protein